MSYYYTSLPSIEESPDSSHSSSPASLSDISVDDATANNIVTLSPSLGLFPASTDFVSGNVLVGTSNQNSSMGAIEHDVSEAGSLRTLSGLEEVDYGGAHRYFSLERRDSVIEIVSDDSDIDFDSDASSEASYVPLECFPLKREHEVMDSDSENDSDHDRPHKIPRIGSVEHAAVESVEHGASEQPQLLTPELTHELSPITRRVAIDLREYLDKETCSGSTVSSASTPSVPKAVQPSCASNEADIAADFPAAHTDDAAHAYKTLGTTKVPGHSEDCGGPPRQLLSSFETPPPSDVTHRQAQVDGVLGNIKVILEVRRRDELTASIAQKLLAIKLEFLAAKFSREIEAALHAVRNQAAEGISFLESEYHTYLKQDAEPVRGSSIGDSTCSARLSETTTGSYDSGITEPSSPSSHTDCSCPPARTRQSTRIVGERMTPDGREYRIIRESWMCDREIIEGALALRAWETTNLADHY
ncbi:hypothetical protein BDV97DRAFT_349542 [Delphinella strobiligena]|nr:hypothetical protein BDV97DRAFT_349542 [Delphinella strobiligena]